MKNKWLHYLFDLIVIIIGITISFWLNNLREIRQEHNEEVRLLEEVKQNLITDSLTIYQEIEEFKRAGVYFEKLIVNPLERPLDSLTEGYYMMLNYSALPFTEIGYTELKAGGLKYISNNELATHIIRHYNKENWSMKEYNEIDKNFVTNQTIPYTNKNFPFFFYSFSEFENHPDKLQKLQACILSEEFKNFVKASSIFKNKQISLYLDNLRKKKELIRKIEAELENLD